jgi:hypothetical protein
MTPRKLKRVLTPLQRLILDLDEIKVGHFKFRGKQVHSERIEKYLFVSPRVGLRMAKADERKTERAKRGQSDMWWWDIECERMLYAGLIEVYENLLAGIPLESFPPLRNKRGEIIVSRLEGMSVWLRNMQVIREKKGRKQTRRLIKR